MLRALSCPKRAVVSAGAPFEIDAEEFTTLPDMSIARSSAADWLGSLEPVVTRYFYMPTWAAYVAKIKLSASLSWKSLASRKSRDV